MTSNAENDAGLVRVDSWKVVCQECRSEYEDWNGWTIFGEQWHAVESAVDADWTVREGLVLCSECGHRKVCMDEDRKCVRRDLTEADDGWMYCPEHIESGMDERPIPPGRDYCSACMEGDDSGLAHTCPIPPGRGE